MWLIWIQWLHYVKEIIKNIFTWMDYCRPVKIEARIKLIRAQDQLNTAKICTVAYLWKIPWEVFEDLHYDIWFITPSVLLKNFRTRTTPVTNCQRITNSEQSWQDSWDQCYKPFWMLPIWPLIAAWLCLPTVVYAFGNLIS